MSVARRYQLEPGQALNRTHLQELFLEAATRLQSITGESIAKLQMGRDRFTAYTFEEYWFAREDQLQFRAPEYGGQVPGTTKVVKTSAPSLEFEVAWSLELTTLTDSCIVVAAWPTAGHQGLWALESCAQMNAEIITTGFTDPPPEAAGLQVPQGEHISLGSTGRVILPGGDVEFGVVIAGIGKWNVQRAALSVRAVHR